MKATPANTYRVNYTRNGRKFSDLFPATSGDEACEKFKAEMREFGLTGYSVDSVRRATRTEIANN